MRAIDLIELIAEYKGRTFRWLGEQCGESKSQIYNRKAAEDIKVEVLKKYVKKLDCHIEIVDNYSPARWLL